MKINYLLLSCFVLASCSPAKTLFIKNQTERPIKIIISDSVKNSFFTGKPSVLHLNTFKTQKDTILSYGKGKRWTDNEKNELVRILNGSTIIFTDRGDTLKIKHIAVQNIGINVNELYVRIKK